MTVVKIKQVKSAIDRPKDQKSTLIALGLRKMNQERIIELNPQLGGMINKVKHLLIIEEVEGGAAPKKEKAPKTEKAEAKATEETAEKAEPKAKATKKTTKKTDK